MNKMESEDFSSSRTREATSSVYSEFQGEVARVTDTTTTVDREDMYSNIVFLFPDPSNKITRSKITSNYVCVLMYYYMWVKFKMAFKRLGSPRCVS